LANVEFRGLMGYEGSLRKFHDRESMKTGALTALSRLVETRDLLEDSGLSVAVVSCGGTMSYNIASEVRGVTEIQAGSYIFMDTTYSKYGIDFDYALTILTGVVSTPRPDKVITDAGLKAISTDHGLPSVKGRPELECTALNSEHGHFQYVKQGNRLKPGDTIEVFPSRADTTVCLHDSYVLARRGEVERSLEIACRGKLQ
jgi:D-serine deaminase-like pyridoxal phosphate-dependent protein